MEKIFVSIASYRDPETGPTIKNLLDQADDKNRIIIGICLQQEKNETVLPSHSNIKILEYNWRESQGACWARHNIQKLLYDGEDYYLQLDSHHRFCPNWDSILINTMRKLKNDHEKPIIGGYCGKYLPEHDKDLEDRPLQTNSMSDFTDLGDLMFIPKTIRNFKRLQSNNTCCVPARFLSGHFIFSEKIFCEECLYDPNIYFRGEELSLSARAYTNGYDMFHPTQPIVWHQYGRAGQNKHWDDHTNQNGFLTTWQTRSDKGKERVRVLLGIENNNKIKFGQYGLGNKRTLHEYELYAGLRFKTKQVHRYTYDINNVHPQPKILEENEWENGLMKKYKITMEITNETIKKLKTLENLKYVSLICNNKNNICCYRKDVKKDSFHTFSSDYYIEASMEEEPYSIHLTPYKENTGFLQNYKITNFRQHT